MQINFTRKNLSNGHFSELSGVFLSEQHALRLINKWNKIGPDYKYVLFSGKGGKEVLDYTGELA